MNTFYNDYTTIVSSPFDTQPLVVRGHIKVYLDQAKTQYFTEIPFPAFPFSEVTDKTADGFKTYVDKKVNDLVNSAEWQGKLNELKVAYDMGVYVPQQ